MRLWTARLFGTTGNQMLMVAIGWQIYDLSGSAWDPGLVGLYQFLPALLFTLVAGHVADGWHSGRIIATCILVQALVAATRGCGQTGAWDSRELLLSVSVLLGLTRAFQMAALQALTPSLLPPVCCRGAWRSARRLADVWRFDALATAPACRSHPVAGGGAVWRLHGAVPGVHGVLAVDAASGHLGGC